MSADPLIASSRVAIPADTRDRWYVLFLMTLVYAINIADRYVVSTLIEPIKAEFALSDAEVGFLTGVALAVFYVGAGIPLGVLADRVNRRNMIAVSLTAWSAMTAFCGLAQNYWQLLLARIGVGIGEAGGTPPSLSIISDRFAPRLRAAAASLFSVGAAFGAMLGSTGGGWLSDRYGWRAALIVFGLVGLPVALLVRFTAREPRRGELDPHSPSAAEGRSSASMRSRHSRPKETPAGHILVQHSFLDTLRFIRTQKSLLHLLAGVTVLTFWGWGTMWWGAAFLVRSHGLSVGEAGALLGPMYGIGGTVVLLLGAAWLMSRYGRGDPRRQTWIVAAATLLATIPSIVAFAAQSLAVASVALWIFVPITYLYIGPSFALVQNLVLPGMRAQTLAVDLFVANVANLVLAPQLIGLASDFLALRIADPRQSLRYVLIASAFTGFWAAYHYYAAARDLRGDLSRCGHSR